MLEFRCGWVGVVSALQAEACNTDEVFKHLVLYDLPLAIKCIEYYTVQGYLEGLKAAGT